MGDELRGDNLVHLNVNFSTETEMNRTLDFLYQKSKEGVSFTGLLEAVVSDITIVTAVHNIKSNKGSKTSQSLLNGFTYPKATAGKDRSEYLRSWTGLFRNVSELS